MSRKRIEEVRVRGSVKSEYTIRGGAGVVGVNVSISSQITPNYLCT